MCQFFSFVTDPVNHPAEYYYLDWEYRKNNLKADDADSHSHICAHFKLNEDVCNKFEFNPLTGKFHTDQINSERDDTVAAEKWARRQNYKEIVEPLIVKPIVNPLELPKVEQVTDEQIGWLKEWTSVRASVGASVGDLVLASFRDSVGDSVRDSVGDLVLASFRYSVGDLVLASFRYSVGDSVRDSIRNSVWDSVWDSVWAYTSSFINTDYRYDFTPAIKLWEAGLVPSFDGETWRLHSGVNAEVVYECKQEDLVR